MAGYEGKPYAVFQDSGRQFRVCEGDEVLVDRKPDVQPGDPIVFDRVVLLRAAGDVKVGGPLVQGVRIECEIVGEDKGPKLVVFKYRRRKDSRVKTGHRAKFTRVRVKKIQS